MSDNEKLLILIIDDDIAMSAGIRDNLEIEGYRVLTANTARAGFDIAIKERPDLIILDLMLGDSDGISVCRKLRENNLQQPIVMLTARGEEGDKVLGFEVGADDYVTKPFSLRELIARVHAHTRRYHSTQSHESVIAIGAATVDFKRHQVKREGKDEEVSAKEMDLLRYFYDRRGEVISRETLLRDLWGHQREIPTRTVDNFVVRLRKKIEIDPTKPKILLTVYGSGYKFVI